MYVRAAALSEKFDIPRWTILDYARRGMFPAGAVIHLGRHVRFNAEKIDEWLRAGAPTAAPVPTPARRGRPRRPVPAGGGAR